MNARAETLETKAMWSVPLQSGRCLVPVSGFYEWKASDAGEKLYAVEMATREPFALAALWDCWKNPVNRQEILSYTIITTESNDLLTKISTRMPVIVESRDFDRWLDDRQEPPYDLLRPYPGEKMSLLELFE
jgi:putative SOS response-associated peptidase YedK